MISQTAEHALRAMLYLARQDGSSVSASDIAKAIDAPANYLGKTLQVLAREGLVRGTRGPNGGFRLAVEPERIVVREIVELFSEATRPRVCLLGGRLCSDGSACTAHERWNDIRNGVSRVLHEVTIADLLGTSANVGYCCSSDHTALSAV